MKLAGIDIGSRTVKLAVVEDGRLIHSELKENSFNPLLVCDNILDNIEYDKITATGYGRHLFANSRNCDVISEIKAFSIGAQYVHPSTRTIIDIGGQDIKVISLTEDGRMSKFEMNDKCAAGTGRFLEIMAMALGCTLDEFGNIAINGGKPQNINSMCTVFAESEVVSLLARGAVREEVALGIYQAVVNKIISMLRRISINNDLIFVGGVARHNGIHKVLEKYLDIEIIRPDNPQLIGAYGAALSLESENKC